MPRLRFFIRPAQLNLTVEEALKRNGHIFAAGQRRSLSQMFSDWLRPQIDKDKAVHPERYRTQATGK